MALILRTALAVPADMLDAFETVSARWVEATRDEAGTLGFHCFLDRSGGTALFLEHYVDSDAFGAHAAAVSPDLRAALYATCSFTGLDVYGPVSIAVREKLAAAGATFYEHVAST